VTATASDGRNVPLVPGVTVGEGEDCRWRVVRHIADGGFSSVYEVQPDSPETTARYGSVRRALKCLWGTPAELTAIGGEAAKMAAVSGHDNVLGLVGSFRFDGAQPPHPHYVGLLLELAAEDLRHFAGRAGPSERAWAAVFEQVAAGLEHIHARRVVHGDIKPTNVLRVDGRFAIADFGVAAPLETTRSAGIGLARTIAFWPPESASQGVLCADGVRRPPAEGWRATQAGDVWALAVSMHRMLTGRHITPGTTPEQQYELVCLGKYSIDDRLGPGWHRLLSDCLAHDPDQRAVSTAADLRRRLSDLALAGDFDGVPWTDRRPRVVAVLDLDGDRPDGGGLDPITRPGSPPALDRPPRSGLEPGQPTTTVGTGDVNGQPDPEPAASGRPGAGAARTANHPDGLTDSDGPGAAPAGAGEVGSADQPGGRAAGTPPAFADRPGARPDGGPAGTSSGFADRPGARPDGGPAGTSSGFADRPGARPDGGPAGTPSGSADRPGSWPDGRPAGMAPGFADQADARTGGRRAARAAEPVPGLALVLYLTRPGGRVHGAVLPGGGLLLEATRHLTEQVVPALAKQTRDHARAAQQQTRQQSRQVTRALTAARPDDVAATIVVGRNDRTRELTVAVADVTRQRDAIAGERDQLAGERDQLARHRDELAGERDRLRQQYIDLAHRMDRLEHDSRRRDRDMAAAPTAVYRSAEPLLATRREAVPVVPAVAPVVEDPPKPRPAARRRRERPAPPPAPPRRTYSSRVFRRLRRLVLFLMVVCILLAIGLSVAGSFLADRGYDVSPSNVVHKIGDVVNGQ
jgi:serine/threonine protein kinase